MPNLLNTSSVMMCPHGGTVSVASSNTRAKGGGDFLVRSSDTFTIAGCPFVVGTVAHPCTQVKWVQTNQRSKAMNDATLNDAGVGLCVAADQAPQGTVLINFTQPRVSGL